MDHRKRSANLEPVVMLDEDDDSAESLNKLLKLDRNKFKTIQTEMRTKGQMLSQNWSDLFGLMSKYQAELLTRQDQLIDIESEIQMRKKNNDQENELEKMKLQLQAKDREIKSIHIDMLNKNAVLTRTQNELGRLKSDLRSKDRLIQKLQNQIQSDDSFSGTTDSPLTPKQVSGKATSSTTFSTVPVEEENTSNIQADVTGLGAHVSLKRSGSDDCVPSASDDECESFEPMEADVHDAGSIPQDGSTAEEVQPGTSGTDNSGQTEEYVTIQTYPQQISIESIPEIQKWADGKPNITVEECEMGYQVQPRYSASSPQVSTPVTQRILGKSPSSSPGSRRFRNRCLKDCPHCGKTFRDSSNYSKHVRTHTGEKPYVCDYCDKRFSDATNCNRHRMQCYAKSQIKVVRIDIDEHGNAVEVWEGLPAPPGPESKEEEENE